MGMESTDFTPETLSQMPKDDLVQMVIGLLNNQKEMAKNLEILTHHHESAHLRQKNRISLCSSDVF